ncbi:hypothetical protein PI124_g11897 [Phytophthora idaei]|nr:hypothetical protein PI124_g11897 [Phytophthora idaei]
MHLVWVLAPPVDVGEGGCEEQVTVRAQPLHGKPKCPKSVGGVWCGSTASGCNAYYYKIAWPAPTNTTSIAARSVFG